MDRQLEAGPGRGFPGFVNGPRSAQRPVPSAPTAARAQRPSEGGRIISTEPNQHINKAINIMARIGKTARLPRPVRIQLNSRLQDGAEGNPT